MVRKTVACLFVFPLLTMTACAVDDARPATADATSKAPQSASAAGQGSVECTYVNDRSPAKPVKAPDKMAPNTGTVTYTVTLNEGPVAITMDRAKTPCTVNSFGSLAAQGWFDKTQCHRLVDQGIFVLQCGDPTGTGRGGPGYRFADELTGKETYPAGTVAMANSGPGTATNGSQFFFVFADTKLPAGYTVFGTMDQAGLATIKKIAAQGHEGAGGEGKPKNEARITSVTGG